MKKAFKYLFFFIIAVIIVFTVIFYFYRSTTVNNLKEKENLANQKWKEFYENRNNRAELIKKIALELEDSTLLVLSNTNNQFKNECSLDFVKQEHDINEILITRLAIDSTKNIDINSVIQEINKNNITLNKLSEQYNSSVKDYNVYISVFPNFFIAKSNGFKKKKYFTIEYGVKNEDPVVKSKELPDWAKNKDTL